MVMKIPLSDVVRMTQATFPEEAEVTFRKSDNQIIIITGLFMDDNDEWNVRSADHVDNANVINLHEHPRFQEYLEEGVSDD